MTSATIKNCSASGDGGGIYVEGGKLTLKDDTISADTAKFKGGGMFIGGGNVKMTGGSFFHNQATVTTAGGEGGGICLYGGIFTLKGGVDITSNEAYSGAGMSIVDGTVSISGGTFQFNTAQLNGNGGGIYNVGGNLTLKGGVYVGPENSANKGGGMYLADGSTTTFGGVTVSSNSASAGGTGVAYENGAGMNGLPAGLSDKDDPGGTPVQV